MTVINNVAFNIIFLSHYNIIHMNAVILKFLFCPLFPSSIFTDSASISLPPGNTWVTFCLLASSSLCALPLLLVREDYARSSIDRADPSLSTRFTHVS